MKKLSGKWITVPLARRIVGLPGHASSKFNRCIGNKLLETHPHGKKEAQDQFTEAAHSCKGTRG